jgi:putative colanic acid biosynthesis acetyltransferase WcaF
VRLDQFHTTGFDRGASRWREALWLAVSGLLFSTWLPGSKWRAALLRLFGARIGRGVVIKPRVQVKFPWRLSIGEHCWIGERVWIDNLAAVSIGDHVCISQGTYICTGSHDWASESFDLIVRPIAICAKAWIGAKSLVAPGCEVGEGAVLTLGSVATGCLEPWMIYSGSPAVPVKRRVSNSTEKAPT